MKENKFWSFFSNTFVRIILVIVIVFFLFNIVRSIIKNYDVVKQIDDYNSQIVNLENDQLNLKNRILLYNTDVFKELEAREHLGYQKPDERVVVLIKKTPNEINLDNISSKDNSDKTQKDLPNWQKWLKFIFS